MPDFAVWLRYPRLYWSFARYCLIREMGFRFNFLTRCIGSVFWLAMIVLFFQLIYLRTERIGDWDRYQYLFFMGTGFILNALMNAFFLENCTNLSELIRTGNLDFALLRPIDEQFLLTCQRIDWSTVPNVLVGGGLLVYSCLHTGVAVTPQRVLIYLALLLAGLAILYSIMLALSASSVWMVRNQSLYEIWFYVNQFARYPADVYSGNWIGNVLRVGLMFIVPVLLAVNVPAQYGVEFDALAPWLVVYLFGAAAFALVASRWFFRFSLTAYRSASS